MNAQKNEINMHASFYAYIDAAQCSIFYVYMYCRVQYAESLWGLANTLVSPDVTLENGTTRTNILRFFVMRQNNDRQRLSASLPSCHALGEGAEERPQACCGSGQGA